MFVDGLDLAEMSFERIEPAATGRPSYHPSVLLKLCIYGYLNRVQSSRRLEREAGRNVEVMWLLGRLARDHKTIADFRKDNGLALRRGCARFVELCREAPRSWPETPPGPGRGADIPKARFDTTKTQGGHGQLLYLQSRSKLRGRRFGGRLLQ